MKVEPRFEVRDVILFIDYEEKPRGCVFAPATIESIDVKIFSTESYMITYNIKPFFKNDIIPLQEENVFKNDIEVNEYLRKQKEIF